MVCYLFTQRVIRCVVLSVSVLYGALYDHPVCYKVCVSHHAGFYGVLCYHPVCYTVCYSITQCVLW